MLSDGLAARYMRPHLVICVNSVPWSPPLLICAAVLRLLIDTRPARSPRGLPHVVWSVGSGGQTLGWNWVDFSCLLFLYLPHRDTSACEWESLEALRTGHMVGLLATTAPLLTSSLGAAASSRACVVVITRLQPDAISCGSLPRAFPCSSGLHCAGCCQSFTVHSTLTQRYCLPLSNREAGSERVPHFLWCQPVSEEVGEYTKRG